MLQKIKNVVVALALVAGFAAPIAAPAVVFADANIQNNLCKGVNLGDGGGCATNADESSISQIAGRIVNLLSIVIGIVAVIMIIFAGFKYITSGGDSNNVSGAKNTLIYAIIGLIIVALAQFIVRFVLNEAGDFAG
jgi:hypothetical protein